MLSIRDSEIKDASRHAKAEEYSEGARMIVIEISAGSVRSAKKFRTMNFHPYQGFERYSWEIK